MVEFPNHFAVLNFKIELHDEGINYFCWGDLTYGPRHMLEPDLDNPERTTWIDDAGNPFEASAVDGAEDMQVLFDILFDVFPFHPLDGGHGREHLLFSWLTSQPPEIQALIHVLSKNGGLSLTWDRLRRYPVAIVTTPEASSVLSAMKIPKLQIAVRAA